MEIYLFLFDRVCGCLSLVASASAFRFSPWPLGWGEASDAVTEDTMLDPSDIWIEVKRECGGVMSVSVSVSCQCGKE